MPVCTETIDVVCFTSPDTFTFGNEAHTLHYQRIVGACLADNTDESATIGDEDPDGEYTVIMPSDMAVRLLRAIRMIDTYRALDAINCHHFSRLVTGITTARLADAMRPVTHHTRHLSPASTVGLGRIGLVGLGDRGVAHSLVGLGPDNPDSLQVISGGGEPGFADTDSVVKFYQSLFPRDEVGLYEL